jgi:hypothetical protein
MASPWLEHRFVQGVRLVRPHQAYVGDAFAQINTHAISQERSSCSAGERIGASHRPFVRELAVYFQPERVTVVGNFSIIRSRSR